VTDLLELSDDDLLALMEDAISAAGGVAKFARLHGDTYASTVSVQVYNARAGGRKTRLGLRLLRALGLRPVTVYRPDPDARDGILTRLKTLRKRRRV